MKPQKRLAQKEASKGRICSKRESRGEKEISNLGGKSVQIIEDARGLERNRKRIAES